MKTKLQILMCLLCYSITTYALNFTLGNIRYRVLTNQDEVGVCGTEGSGVNVIIPANISYQGKTYKVTRIEDGAFHNNQTLVEITIGENIEAIGTHTTGIPFNGCYNLSRIVWKAKQCSSGIWSNSYTPFYTSRSDCGTSVSQQITEITFTDDVITIPAFLCLGMSNLETVKIGKNVQTIGGYNCQYFQNIFISDLTAFCNISRNEYCGAYRLFLNNTELTDLVIPSTVNSIQENTFRNCVSILSLSTNNTTNIADNAFNGCANLSMVIFSKQISQLGQNVFIGCPIQNIDFNSINCNDFSGQIFDSWSVLNVTFGSEVKHIPAYLCRNQSLQSVVIPKNIESVGSSAFLNCKHLKIITWNAINCDVASSIFTSHTSWSSDYDSVQSVIIGSQVTKIPDYLCANMTQITRIDIPASVQSINRGAFYGCSNLVDVIFPTIGLKEIGNDAFNGCENITSINLPSSLTDIGSKAFYGCSALRVVLPDSLVHIGANALYNTFTYSLDRNWNNGVLYVNNYLIQGVDSKGLSASCSIQEGTTLIADAAFSGSSNLISVTLPASLRHIGNRAFYNCAKINSAIILPEHLETIGDSAMYFKSNIKTSFVYDLYLPRTLTYIGSGAFWNDNSNKAAISAIYAYMKTPPTIDTRTFNLQTSMANTPVYVYADDANSYYNAEVWKQFDIQVISAPSVTVNDSIEIDITRTGATFKWQEIAQAKTYILVVQNQNGDTVEIVAINDQGEVKYDDRRLAKSSIASANGFQYTISNLENNTNYTYILQVKNASGNVLKEYSDSFVTGLRYSVRFVDWDDALLKEEIVRESESATPPENPSREGYTFIGWDKEYTNINSNLTIKAQYERDVVYYTVTFLDWDGSELFVEQVEEGQAAKGPSVLPTREGYTFTGWSKPITNIQSNLIVIAQYQLNEGIEDIYIDGVNSCKVIIDGQIFIIRGNKRYTVQGQEIR